jgi:hypothetical protein
MFEGAGDYVSWAQGCHWHGWFNWGPCLADAARGTLWRGGICPVRLPCGVGNGKTLMAETRSSR